MKKVMRAIWRWLIWKLEPETEIRIAQVPWDKGPRMNAALLELDEEDFNRWLKGNDKVERNYPLLVMKQVKDEIMQSLAAQGKYDALMLAELRGGLRWLNRFATLFLSGTIKKPKIIVK